MPRRARLLLGNSYYHLVNRGNQKQKIFLETADYEKYLEILKHYKYKFKFKLLGYCLMPNHIHLILEPKEVTELASLMQGVSQTYTTWFNDRYTKVGHLWQSRFKSMLINKDEYFLECVYYVEANPVRAGLSSSPGGYPWSSYRERIFGSNGGLLDIPNST